MTNMAQIPPRSVVIGVDTHLDQHTAAVKDELGRNLGEAFFPTSSCGYKELLAWARGFGEVAAFGIEETGSYGAGLSRFLSASGALVIEVCRPSRQQRRRHGKSDPADARAAAAAVLSGEAAGLPKAGNSTVEMIRMVRTAKTSAVRARTQALNVLRASIVTAPAGLREELSGLSTARLICRAAALRPGPITDPISAAKHTIRSLAKRFQELDVEISRHVAILERLTAEVCPRLVQSFGIGADSAAALLIAAGDNPERMGSEAAFAMLCGASPVDASSGKQLRHRLNRGGDRQANAALYRVVLVRLRWHGPTQDYVARRTAEGKTKREIMRCLKRFVAREAYNLMMASAGEQQSRLKAAA